MKITVDLRVDAPELAESLRRLADAIPHITSPGMVRAVYGPALNTSEESTENSAAAEEERAEPQVTLEQVRAKLASLSQAGKQDQVKTLITEFGGKKLSDIDPVQYSKLLAKADELA